jgi:L-asparaginase II
VTQAGGVPLVEVVRSGFVESVHRGSVVVLGADGTVAASAGDVNVPIFPRSVNKPLQTVGMLRAGLRLAGPADLALVCASHHGEDFHRDRVAALLRGAGLTAEALACPPDLPLSEAARTAVLRAGMGPDRLRMNCSGKHAGMLLTCLAAGWPLVGYHEPGHPLQRLLRRVVEEFTGEPVAAVGVDGCAAPVFAVSLTGLARAYLRLVDAPVDTAEKAVSDAMRAHPEYVSGTVAEEARLSHGVPGLLVKNGAEAVIAAALPGTGAVAIKIDDGGTRARIPALVDALRRIGVAAGVLDELARPPVLGGGRPVGCLRAVGW